MRVFNRIADAECGELATEMPQRGGRSRKFHVLCGAGWQPAAGWYPACAGFPPILRRGARQGHDGSTQKADYPSAARYHLAPQLLKLARYSYSPTGLKPRAGLWPFVRQAIVPTGGLSGRRFRYATNFSGFAAGCLRTRSRRNKCDLREWSVGRRPERPPAGTIACPIRRSPACHERPTPRAGLKPRAPPGLSSKSAKLSRSDGLAYT